MLSPTSVDESENPCRMWERNTPSFEIDEDQYLGKYHTLCQNMCFMPVMVLIRRGYHYRKHFIDAVK